MQNNTNPSINPHTSFSKFLKATKITLSALVLSAVLFQPILSGYAQEFDQQLDQFYFEPSYGMSELAYLPEEQTEFGGSGEPILEMSYENNTSSDEEILNQINLEEAFDYQSPNQVVEVARFDPFGPMPGIMLPGFGTEEYLITRNDIINYVIPQVRAGVPVKEAFNNFCLEYHPLVGYGGTDTKVGYYTRNWMNKRVCIQSPVY